jgi:hypothetical protein
MPVSSNFQDDIESSKFSLITIIEIIRTDDTVYYANTTCTDTTPDCLPYITGDVSISGSRVDIREVSSSLATASWSLTDKDSEVTLDMSNESYINKQVNIYNYFDNTGNTFPTDALRVFSGKIDTFDSNGSSIKFSAREVRLETAKSLFDAKTNLNGSLTNVATTITVDDTSFFPSSGKIKIEDEVISYTGKTLTTFTGCTRAQLNSTAVAHNDDQEVYEVFQSGSVNPITFMLQLLLSVDGDGSNHATYDVLREGIGLSPDDIDIASFTTIRDANSFGNYSFNISEGIDNALRFIEEQLQAPTITRMFTSADGLLKLAQLDQSEFVASTEFVDDDVIVGTPTLKISSRDIINDIDIEYKYDLVSDTFQGFRNQTDAESVDMYGTLPSAKKKFSFMGMQTQLQADEFLDNYLQRNSTPVPRLSFKTFFSKRLLSPGDDIFLSSNNVPNVESGTRSFSGVVEILSVSQNKDVISFETAYTRFTTGRAVFVSPARSIASKSSETVFTLASGGDFFRAGMNVRLFDSTIGSNMTLYCDFTSSENANYSAGSGTALINGSTSVSGGYLNLSGSGNNSIGFSGDLNAPNPQNGCIRIRVKPNYTGNPATDQYFVSIGNTGDLSNLIHIYHSSAGNLTAQIYSEAETQILSISSAWSPTSGTSYEIELNYNLGTGLLSDSGSTKLFVGGTQLGSTNTATGKRSDSSIRTRHVQYITLGSDRTNIKTSNFYIQEFAIFKSVQHTTTYTPALFDFAESSDYRTITNISGNTITIDSAFDITIDTSKHYLAFADYEDLSSSPLDQKFWGSVSEEEGFDDGTSPYIIKG